MDKKTFLGIVLILLLLYLSVLAKIQPIQAEDRIIYLRFDGEIEPSTAPILRNGNFYIFTADIFGSIVVERSKIIVDGKGYLLQGKGTENGFQLDGVNNVTLQNMNIQNFSTAFLFNNSSYNNIF